MFAHIRCQQVLPDNILKVHIVLFFFSLKLFYSTEAIFPSNKENIILITGHGYVQ